MHTCSISGDACCTGVVCSFADARYTSKVKQYVITMCVMRVLYIILVLYYFDNVRCKRVSCYPSVLC